MVDISSNNILQGIEDTSILCKIEEDEMKRPIARKVLPDRNIYYSRPLPVNEALPVLSDLGEAQLGKSHNGDIMPGIYRAPEVILGMDRDGKVDIWSVGMMVSCTYFRKLFLHYLGRADPWPRFGIWRRAIISFLRRGIASYMMNSTWQKWCHFWGLLLQNLLNEMRSASGTGMSKVCYSRLFTS